MFETTLNTCISHHARAPVGDVRLKSLSPTSSGTWRPTNAKPAPNSSKNFSTCATSARSTSASRRGSAVPSMSKRYGSLKICAAMSDVAGGSTNAKLFCALPWRS
jgi:hypothetical protein